MTAHEEALRLNRLVRNLLDMTRLDAGALKVKKELQPLEEVVGAALYRLDDRLRGRAVGTDIPHDLPLAAFDAILIEQVLINLIENAVKHTPAGQPHRRRGARARRARWRSRSPTAGPASTGPTWSASSRSSFACARARAAGWASG